MWNIHVTKFDHPTPVDSSVNRYVLIRIFLPNRQAHFTFILCFCSLLFLFFVQIYAQNGTHCFKELIWFLMYVHCFWLRFCLPWNSCSWVYLLFWPCISCFCCLFLFGLAIVSPCFLPGFCHFFSAPWVNVSLKPFHLLLINRTCSQPSNHSPSNPFSTVICQPFLSLFLVLLSSLSCFVPPNVLNNIALLYFSFKFGYLQLGDTQLRKHNSIRLRALML